MSSWGSLISQEVNKFRCFVLEFITFCLFPFKLVIQPLPLAWVNSARERNWAFSAQGTIVQTTEVFFCLVALVIGITRLQEHGWHTRVGCVWGHLTEHRTDTGRYASSTDTRVGFLGMDVTGLGFSHWVAWEVLTGTPGQPRIVATERKL